MVEIIFIEHDGTEHRTAAEPGRSIMEIAMDNGLPGLLADCGGNCSCGTCRGYVAREWADKLESVSFDEQLMLNMVANQEEGCRLTCQIDVSEAIDGIEIRWPESQM